MGTVYLGTSPGGRPVAVKMVRPDLADDPGFRARFASEVRLARRVDSFCTAPVVDADPDAAQPWLATLYVPAPSLRQAVREEGPLPLPAARVLAAGLAEALVAIHDCGIVHRDLKPSNVLLAPDGPRLIDFGIARALDGISLTATGLLVGSPGYMAPEQAEGGEAGPAADVFALAATVGYAASGRALFGTGEPHAVLYRVMAGEPDLSPVPSALHDLLTRCLAKDPRARPAARQVLADLCPAAQSAWQGQAGWLPAAVTRLAERQSTAVLTVTADATSPLTAPTQRKAARVRRSGLQAVPAAGVRQATAARPAAVSHPPGVRTSASRVRPSVAANRAEYGLPPWPKNGFGTASLVLGVVGMTLFFGPGVLLGLIGLPLGLLGIRRARRGVASNRGVAIAGVVTSVLAVVISLSVLNAVGRWVECAEQFPGDAAQQAACRSGDSSSR